MFYSGNVAVCFESHTKNRNALCEQNVKILNVKPGDTYSNRWAFAGWIWLSSLDVTPCCLVETIYQTTRRHIPRKPWRNDTAELAYPLLASFSNNQKQPLTYVELVRIMQKGKHNFIHSTLRHHKNNVVNFFPRTIPTVYFFGSDLMPYFW